MNKELSANTELSHYRIVSKIGAGGMGEVYRAHDSRLDREVAIKLLPADFTGDEDRLRRFEQEAKATSALNHPNILTVYDIGEHEGSPFIVAELLEGEELRQRLDEGPITLRKVTEYAQQIVSGLSAAHEKGIVHRDLKPENLFTTDDRVKILDFGLAKLREPKTNIHGSEDATLRALTNPGVVMGTVGYMSPEQVRGRAIDHRSDIFSFGLILHEMITGRRAFQHETMAETMSAILKEEPEELIESNPNVSPSLERIVRRCLEKKPERRFQSTSDLGFALESLSAPTSSSRNNMTTSASAIAAESDKPAGRFRILWIAAAVLALAVIGSGIWYFGRGWLTPAAASVAEVTYQPVTFEKGFVFTARFAPDEPPSWHQPSLLGIPAPEGSTARSRSRVPQLSAALPLRDLPLLKIDLTRDGPCEERFADGGKVQRINDRRERDNPGFDVSPCFAATVEELTPNDLREIESAFSKIKVQGARLSEEHMKLIDR